MAIDRNVTEWIGGGVFGSAGDLILGTGRTSAGRHRNKSYGNIRQDTLCPVRDLNPWPPESNSIPTYSNAKLCSSVALCGTYPSCITNYTFQDLLYTTAVYAVICIFSQSWFSHDKFEHVSGKCLTTELRTKYYIRRCAIGYIRSTQV